MITLYITCALVAVSGIGYVMYRTLTDDVEVAKLIERRRIVHYLRLEARKCEIVRMPKVAAELNDIADEVSDGMHT